MNSRCLGRPIQQDPLTPISPFWCLCYSWPIALKASSLGKQQHEHWLSMVLKPKPFGSPSCFSSAKQLLTGQLLNGLSIHYFWVITSDLLISPMTLAYFPASETERILHSHRTPSLPKDPRQQRPRNLSRKSSGLDAKLTYITGRFSVFFERLYMFVMPHMNGKASAEDNRPQQNQQPGTGWKRILKQLTMEALPYKGQYHLLDSNPKGSFGTSAANHVCKLAIWCIIRVTIASG